MAAAPAPRQYGSLSGLRKLGPAFFHESAMFPTDHSVTFFPYGGSIMPSAAVGRHAHIKELPARKESSAVLEEKEMHP